MPAPYEIVVLDVGGAALAIPFQRAGQADPEVIGGIDRAYAGNQYTSIIAEYMVIPLVSGRVTSTLYAQVKALFALGAQIDCQAGSAGNVFEGVTSVITCSGKVTGEMIPGTVGSDGKPLWIMNLTLTQVGTAASSSAETIIYLSPAVSPTDPAALLASTLAADDPFVGGSSSKTLLDGETITTCGNPLAPDPMIACATTYSLGVELEWLTKATALGGWASGMPRLEILSIGGTGDRWDTQACMVEIYVVRGGVDILQWDTAYSNGNGGFAGDVVTAYAPSIIYQFLPGDRLRIKLFGRAGLNSGYADDGFHQEVSYGNGGAGSHQAKLILGGAVLFEA